MEHANSKLGQGLWRIVHHVRGTVGIDTLLTKKAALSAALLDMQKNIFYSAAKAG